MTNIGFNIEQEMCITGTFCFGLFMEEDFNTIRIEKSETMTFFF